MAEHDQEASKPKNLLDELIARSQSGRSVTTRYKLVHDPEQWKDPGPLLDVLNVSAEALTEQGKSVLEFIERNDQKDVDVREWIDFKWKLTAFEEIQDIFDSPLYDGKEMPLNIFQVWYFYFESMAILRESTICWLNGLYVASRALLRPFVEFSALQLYYYQNAHATQSYKRLEDYFEKSKHPSWNSALNRALPDDSFCRPIKKRLDLHLKALSENVVHAYHPEHSSKHHSSQAAQASLEGIFNWQLIRFVLQSVLWSYYAVFPMLFHPRNAMRKFGFNGPIGVFVDAQCATAVRRSLGEAEFRDFLGYSQKSENVSGLISWYESHPDLSDDQIKATWDEAENGAFDNMDKAYARQMAKMRAIRESMALRPRKNSPLNENDGFDFERFFTYDRWKKSYKRVRNRSGRNAGRAS